VTSRRQIFENITARTKVQLRYARPPLEFRGYVVAVMNILGPEYLFTKGGLRFIHEAYVGAELGVIRGAVSVSLIDAERPDFALQFDNRTELYEVVEADRPGRRRGDEYKALKAAGYPITHWPVEDWANGEQAYDALHAMAEKKAKKAAKLAAKGIPYPEQTRLLFYLNLMDFGAHTEEIISVFSRAIEPARKGFSSVWVLWKNLLYEV
jgi:hypothetical protein